MKREKSSVNWVKGRGALGASWEKESQEVYDLEGLSELRENMTQADFDDLPVEDRLGMTYRQVQATENSTRYTAAWVAPFYKGPDTNRTVAGFISVDVVGTSGAAEILEEIKLTKSRDLGALLDTANRAMDL